MRTVYTKLRDFEAYLHSRGVATESGPAPECNGRDPALLTQQEALDALRALTFDHAIRLMHTVSTDASFDQLLEQARGEKMLFGANRDKGLVRENGKLKAVTVGEDGYTIDDVLTHDAHERDTSLHLMLAAMKYPDMPVAVGVIREVEDTHVYDRKVAEQVAEVRNSNPIRCMDDLLHAGETWKIG